MAAGNLSHFELLSELSRDAIGSVYLARDLSQQRSVAVRIIPAAAFPSEQAKRRFVQDTLAVKKIIHPNIASVYEVEEIEGRLEVAFEPLEGEPLSRRIGRLTSPEASGILRQILEGLKAAHAAGIIHGGLSPECVFVSKEGAVKLVSFGMGPLTEAWLNSGDEAQLDLGDPWVPRSGDKTQQASEDDRRLISCLSPEVIQGAGSNEKSDLWSAGVLIHEMLSGAPAFEGEDVPALVFDILNSEPGWGLEQREDVPGDAKRLVHLLLRKDPEERPSSADEAIACLEPRANEMWAGQKRLSLAVTYFAFAGADEGKSYLATVLAEEVISRLSRMGELAVTTRHDVLALRDIEVDPAELARCMGVGAVLTGKVWSLGDAVRVAVRLTAADAGREVWTGYFDRPASLVCDLAGEIAVGVLDVLCRNVGDYDWESAALRWTDDPLAYDLYARGRELLTRRGRKNTVAAIRMFRYAVACDADLSAAHESLAAAYSGMFTYYDGAPVWLDLMAGAARRALELDPDLIEARLHLAMVLFHRKDYDGAREALKEFIEMRPDYYEAHRWLGILSDITGKYDEALEHYYRSAEIKPCSVEPWLYVNMTHRRRADSAAAMGAAKKFLEVGLKTLHIAPDDPVTLSRFCVVYTLFDEKEKARDALNRILRTGTEDGLVLYNCASTYALLGDETMSLDCLRRALDGGYKNVREWIENDPDFVEICKAAAFRDLLSEFDLQHERRDR